MTLVHKAVNRAQCFSPEARAVLMNDILQPWGLPNYFAFEKLKFRKMKSCSLLDPSPISLGLHRQSLYSLPATENLRFNLRTRKEGKSLLGLR